MSAYDLDDPKHPTFRERMFDRADDARKQERENSLLGVVQPPEPEDDDTDG